MWPVPRGRIRRIGLLGAVDDGVEVDLEHAGSPSRRPPPSNGADRHDARVVDEHVDRPQPPLDLVEEGGEAGPVGDVERAGPSAPPPSSSAAASRRRRASTSPIATRQPSLASASASALPMPRPPPVTTATLPCSERGCLAMASSSSSDAMSVERDPTDRDELLRHQRRGARTSGGSLIVIGRPPAAYDLGMDPVETDGRFAYGDRELAYRAFGEGPRVTVLLHGLLLSQRMHVPPGARARRAGQPRRHGRPARPRPLGPPAGDVALQHGLLRPGRGRAARPPRRRARRWSAAPRSARTRRSRSRALAPERLRGMIVEMPVLDNALLGVRRRVHAADGRADRRRARDARALAGDAQRVPERRRAVGGQRAARHRPPGPGAERRRAPGRCSSAAHRAAPRRAAQARRRRRW